MRHGLAVPRASDKFLRDGFDLRVGTIAFDIFTPGGCCLEDHQLSSQSPKTTVEFSVHNILGKTALF